MRAYNRLGVLALTAAAFFAAASCEQGAIFNSISNETKKENADIKGTPTQAVSFGGSIYVANGKLYQRGNPGNWDSISTPGDHKVRDIAASNSYLYALTVNDDDSISSSSTKTKVYRTTDPNDSDKWEALEVDSSLSDYDFLNKLSVANGILYVGARADDESYTYDVKYAVLKANGTTLEAVSSALTNLTYSGEFAGASYDGTYAYLATAGLGVFYSKDSFAAALDNTADKDYSLTGIISTSGGSTVAVGWNEDILVQTAPDGGFTQSNGSYKYTGALAEYDAENDGTPNLLLVGIKSGTTYGYREITLTAGAIIDSSPSIAKPNNSDSTVTDYDQYASSIGVESVQAMYQDWSSGESILYASTYNEGLWSSTDRDEWNLDN